MKIGSEQREQIKKLGKQVGMEVTDEMIDASAARATEHVEYLKLVPFKAHLWQHHRGTGSTQGLGRESIKKIHESAPEELSHPAYEDMLASKDKATLMHNPPEERDGEA